MKISNNQLLPVLSALSNVTFSNVSVDSITGLIAVISEITELRKNFEKVTKVLMESYDIEADEKGNYKFKGHEKEEEIRLKWVELLNKEKVINAELTEENLYAKIGVGLHMQEVLILKEFFATGHEKDAPEKAAKAPKEPAKVKPIKAKQ